MSIPVQSIVLHKHYGKGIVEKVTEDKIYVSFGDKYRIFPYPAAFDKGDLSPETYESKVQGTITMNSGSLMPKNIKHRIMLIKINQLYRSISIRSIRNGDINNTQKNSIVIKIY